jgi:hypothetical protein
LRHWVAFGIEGDWLGRIGQGHAVHPALTAVRAQDQPVDAVALQQLDLVALVENADLPGAELVGRVQEPDQPVADLTALEVLEW